MIKSFCAVEVQLHEFLTSELDGTDAVTRTISLRLRIPLCWIRYEGMWGPEPAWGQRKRENILPFLNPNPDPSVSIVAYSLYRLKLFATVLYEPYTLELLMFVKIITLTTGRCVDTLRKQKSCIWLRYTRYAAVWKALVFRASEEQRREMFYGFWKHW